MHGALEEHERNGVIVKIFHDDDIQHDDPRDWTNLSTMVCWHPQYTLGDFQITDGSGRGAVKNAYIRDDFTSLEKLARWIALTQKPVGGVILTLGLYDHSGISMYVGGKHDYPFDRQGWDTTSVGFIYATPEGVKQCCGDDETSEYFTAEWIEKALRGDVEVYNQWLTGDIYGYIVEDQTGDEIDSCWGIYGMDEAEKEANAVADKVTAEDLQEMQAKRDAAEIAEAEALAAKHGRKVVPA